MLVKLTCCEPSMATYTHCFYYTYYLVQFQFLVLIIALSIQLWQKTHLRDQMSFIESNFYYGKREIIIFYMKSHSGHFLKYKLERMHVNWIFFYLHMAMICYMLLNKGLIWEHIKDFKIIYRTKRKLHFRPFPFKWKRLSIVQIKTIKNM